MEPQRTSSSQSQLEQEEQSCRYTLSDLFVSFSGSFSTKDSTVVPSAVAILTASDALGSVFALLILETVVSETPIIFASQR